MKTSDTDVKMDEELLHKKKKSKPANLPEQTKLPEVKSDKDKDETESAIKIAIGNV